MAIYKIQMRRDTSTNWTTNNPTLNVGEFGYAIDTDELKIGNGTDNWNTLGSFDYTNGTGIDITNGVISLDISNYVTDPAVSIQSNNGSVDFYANSNAK